jgi:hypothetical protein
VQSGNAHEDGLGEQWDTARAYWADPTDEKRAELPDWLNFAGTRDQYLAGLPEHLRALHPPEYHRALERMDAHIYDGGHLLLETHAAECAELMRTFVLDNA